MPPAVTARAAALLLVLCAAGAAIGVSAQGDFCPTAPVIRPPLHDITVNATSAEGAIVTYGAHSSRDNNGTVPIICDPATGSQFAIGSTTVTCTAGVTTENFTVTVAVPAPIFPPTVPDSPIDATTVVPYPGTPAEGAYIPVAIDPIDGDISQAIETTLVPVDGSSDTTGTPIILSGPDAYIFPVGSTLINNTVTNSNGVTTSEVVTIEVAVAPPTFADNAPTVPLESTATVPYLGTTVEGTYIPAAADPIDGDLSHAIETYLVSTNATQIVSANGTQIYSADDAQALPSTPISLTGPDAVILPVGTTQVNNTVTNSQGVTSSEVVTIVVAPTKRTKPVITLKSQRVIVTQPVPAPLKKILYKSNCAGADAKGKGLIVTYNPPSGRRVGTAPFLVGTTSLVTCTVTCPASGQSATAEFVVRVRRPPGQEDREKDWPMDDDDEDDSNGNGNSDGNNGNGNGNGR